MHYLQQPNHPYTNISLSPRHLDINISHFLTLFKYTFQIHPLIFNQKNLQLITKKKHNNDEQSLCEGAWAKKSMQKIDTRGKKIKLKKNCFERVVNY